MIELINLTKRYGNFTAVDDLSLSIGSGGITGLLGPNGAGKTTTMRMITGYFPPSAGKVIIDGINISFDPVAVKKMTGYLPESAPVYGDMLVYDYLKYIASVHSIKGSERIDDTSSMCGLSTVMGKKISNLSKGYKQRVGLAHALIHDPEILILDEPTNGLDPNQIIEIRNLIKEIGKKKTVLLSTHILSEVEASCDRVIIINKGKIAADEKTADLSAKFKAGNSISAEIKYADESNVKNALKAFCGSVEVFYESEGILKVNASSERDIREALFNCAKTNGWVLLSLEKEKNTLENIFKDLTGGSNNA
ncbi:MAG TPA: ATP-binding cassette domain-containing protein [Spirochaetota bacterium]|nr:ATP-binding cassette domain-containing protein [Spirochaetota bacterium]HOR43395.1 ATP-binding cassette domain-containing protein [Spirochaetota bacterium]HPK56349.1 ATP-binding cassette domain-containing protein [Spirochaetota bacterium]